MTWDQIVAIVVNAIQLIKWFPSRWRLAVGRLAVRHCQESTRNLRIALAVGAAFAIVGLTISPRRTVTRVVPCQAECYVQKGSISVYNANVTYAMSGRYAAVLTPSPDIDHVIDHAWLQGTIPTRTRSDPPLAGGPHMTQVEPLTSVYTQACSDLPSRKWDSDTALTLASSLCFLISIPTESPDEVRERLCTVLMALTDPTDAKAFAIQWCKQVPPGTFFLPVQCGATIRHTVLIDRIPRSLQKQVYTFQILQLDEHGNPVPIRLRGETRCVLTNA